MVAARILEGAKWTAETLKGAAITLASPNAPVPKTDLHPRLVPRPWTAQEFLRSWSWRYCWKYIPVFRFYIYSGVIVFAAFKFLVPIKPRHVIQYHKGKADAHHHEVEHAYGSRQKKQDAEYFAKYNPLKKPGEADVGHH